jgi:hypothetical protein
MKITKVEIYNYKSIGEKCVIDFDEKATVLVGKSNVGKTNILEALRFAFNDEPLAKNDICSWYPEQPLSVKVFLKIEKKDIPQVERIDTSFTNLTHIVINKYIDGRIEFSAEPDISVKKWFEPSDEVMEWLSNYRARIRRTLRKFNAVRSQLTQDDPLLTDFSSLDTFVNIDKKLDPMDSEDEQKVVLNELLKLLKFIRKKLDKKQYRNLNMRGIKLSLSNIIRDVEYALPSIKFKEETYEPFTKENLFGLLPRIIYLKSSDELKITDSIFIDDIRNTGSDNFMRGLIDLSEIDINILEKGERRQIKDPLNQANRNIASRLSKYWNQENLTIELNYDIDTSDPGNPRRKIDLDFIGEDKRRSIIFEQSPGTRWFMAFVVEYLANQSDEKDIILLLDEPGILLHAGAQKDLLGRFENTAPIIQIIYTAHSPYMINKNFPLRIRSVGKGSGTDTEIRGTYVDQKPYTSLKCRAWEPLRSSLGISLGDSIFVGGVNLIVEGITDQIILSSIIQVINKIENKAKFDLNKVSITFADDNRNLVALAIFCSQETEGMKVLLDGDRGPETRTKLMKGKINRDQIFIINEILDAETIDIENVFDPEFYHDCVLKAYEELVKLGTCKDLPKKWTDIKKEFSKENNKVTTKWGHAKYYEEYFKKNKEELGDFGKVLVSRKLADEILSLDENEQKKIVEPFKKLIEAIWQQEPSWL